MSLFCRLPKTAAPLRWRNAVVVACCAFSSWSAFAQEQSLPRVLEEVIVTAQKREMEMQSVPIALSVVDQQEIESRAIADFSELFALMPNTTFDQKVSAIPSLSIRGVTSNVDNIGIEAGVGVAVDDVFLGRPSAFSVNLIDIERVEVLRGPQGTLFGKNTIGGLVNIVTAKPRNEFGAEADFTYGEDELTQFRGYVTGPIASERLAGKLSFTVKERDGWVENTNPQAEDLMSVDFWGLRGQLLGTPSDGFSWLLSAEYSEDDSVENYNDLLSGPLAAFDGDPYDRKIGTSVNDLFQREIYGLSLKLDWDWNGLEFVSVTALRGVDWAGRNDQDYTLIPFFESAREEEQDQFSQEFRVLGGSDDFKWIAGLYYFDQEQAGVDTLFLDEGTPPFFGLPPFPGYEERAETQSTLDTKSLAAFVSGTWYFADRWNLNAGLRYTDEDKDFSYRQDLTFYEVAPGVPLGLIAAFNPTVLPFTDSRSDSDWSGDLSLGYAFSEDVNGYAKISRGFKAGGFDTTASPVPDPGSLAFDPETLVSYEIGLKSDLAQRRVRLNLAAFYSDYQDKQEVFFNGVISSTSNAASATIKGLEADLTALATDWLRLGAAFGYQKAEYDEYVDPIAGRDFSGNRLAGVPEWTGALYGQIDRQLVNGWAWMLRADLSYEDETESSQANTPLYSLESRTLVNARLGLTSPSGRWSVSLWSKNLLDEDYAVGKFAISGLFTDYISLNQPRSWGLELRGRWGN